MSVSNHGKQTSPDSASILARSDTSSTSSRSSTGSKGKSGLFGIKSHASSVINSMNGVYDGEEKEAYSNTNMIMLTMLSLIIFIFIFIYYTRIGVYFDTMGDIKWGPYLRDYKSGNYVIGTDGNKVANPHANDVLIGLFGKTGSMGFNILNIVLFLFGGSVPISNLLEHFFPTLKKHDFIRKFMAVGLVLFQVIVACICAGISKSNPSKVANYSWISAFFEVFFSSIVISGVLLNLYVNKKMKVPNKNWGFDIILVILNLMMMIYGCAHMYYHFTVNSVQEEYIIATVKGTPSGFEGVTRAFKTRPCVA